MNMGLTTIYFNELDFSIPPLAEVSSGENLDGSITYIFADVTRYALDPYRFDISHTKLETEITPKIKNADSFSTLIISSEGQLENTVYTANLQNAKGENILKDNIRIPLQELRDTLSKIAKDSYDDAETNMNASNAIITFFENKMSPLLKGDAEFYLLLSKLIESADYENTVKLTSQPDNIEIVQNIKVPRPPEKKH